jgi:hypothetical protein
VAVKSLCRIGIVALVIGASSAAQAFTTVTPFVDFQTLGTSSQASSIPSQLTFANFDSNLGTLSSVRWVVQNVNVGGNVQLGNGTGSAITPGAPTVAPTFTILNIPISGTTQAVTMNLDPVPSFQFVTRSLSGTYTGASSAVAVSPAQADAFANDPVVASYFSVWTSSPTSLLSTFSPDGSPAASLTGQVRLEYEYTPTTPGTAVPGPLPVLGAAAAFGWSRRLRRRITKIAS